MERVTNIIKNLFDKGMEVKTVSNDHHYMAILFFTLIGIITWACSRSPVSENKDSASDLNDVDSTTFVEEKIALADELSELRNSIDTLIIKTSEMKSTSNQAHQDLLDEAIRELSLNKDKVERDIQEVHTTSLKGWREESIGRIRTTIDNVKSEVERIKEDAGLDG